MFERYTEKARRVIFFGRYEASQFGSPYVETEHLLLGVLREDKTLTSRLLKSSGSMEDIRAEIEKHSPIREKVSTSVDLQLSNECKRILAYAAEEADRLRHKQIEVEHLLLGLLREEKCFAAKLLERHGVRLSSARQVFVKTRAESPPAPTVVPSEFPTLADFGFSLTQKAMDGLLPRLIGRELELDRVIQVLCRLTSANPVLVGEPGVGKKSIVYGLAQRVVEGNVPASLANSPLMSVDLAVIASGTRTRSRFEENLDQVLVQLLQGANSVLFFVNGL
jgi:ATP-dependent Clp protease ATP-binding subunit ClpC